MSSLKDHNHFVLVTETCKTKLVNKIRNIEESHDQTASSQVVFPKDPQQIYKLQNRSKDCEIIKTAAKNMG